MKHWTGLLLALIVGIGSAAFQCQAAWELPSIIEDGMVLQQGTAASLWGWDEPGTIVTVTFRNQEQTAIAGADGKWQLRIPTGSAGGPFVLGIKGSQTVSVTGVLVGEVWIAGGQSNMWWHEGGCRNAAGEKATANFPLIRIWDANTSTNQSGWPAETPQRTVPAHWISVTPETVSNLPGVPYFFAREIHQKLKIPVGIVHLAVPGQCIETFLSPTFIQAHLPMARHQQAQLKQPAPSCFFNGMVAPVAPYAARGFLWWQGESNADRHLQYRVLFPGLIEDWRRCWERPDAPFLFVELANFLKPQSQPVEDDTWPALRDAQSFALQLDHVQEVSAIDVLGPDDSLFNIHPPNKQLIGHRLALAARATVYGERRLVWSGPRFQSAQFDGDRVRVSFTQIGSGLITKDGQPLKGFALAGADRQFSWAVARLSQNNTVILTATNVPQPVAARYSWANNPTGTLANQEGLPAFPFRTDHWNLTEK